jgi:hypothetical protein
MMMLIICVLLLAALSTSLLPLPRNNDRLLQPVRVRQDRIRRR